MGHDQLRERKEAYDVADAEFQKVKKRKLETERESWRPMFAGSREERQKEREAANRASAAASRAKIICLSRELGKRTDKLERERNDAKRQVERNSRKNKTLIRENDNLKRVLNDIWKMKEHQTCTYLVESNALFFLQRSRDNIEGFSSDSEDDSKHVDLSPRYTASIGSPAQESIAPNYESDSAGALPGSRAEAGQKSPPNGRLAADPTSRLPVPAPVRTSLSVRSLVHPSNSFTNNPRGDTRMYGCLPP